LQHPEAYYAKKTARDDRHRVNRKKTIQKRKIEALGSDRASSTF